MARRSSSRSVINWLWAVRYTQRCTGGFTDDAVIRHSRVAPGALPGIGLEGKAEFHGILGELHQ
ncbi:hypothetical protein [Luteococcus sp.]|uniref:hypothetical protein n=1 Tax=Luteococcus sp. TaxID=1969402 RepID=UPI003736C64C